MKMMKGIDAMNRRLAMSMSMSMSGGIGCGKVVTGVEVEGFYCRKTCSRACRIPVAGPLLVSLASPMVEVLLVR